MAKLRTFAVTTLVLVASGSIAAPTPDSNNAPLLKGQAAMGGWQQDNRGLRRLLTPQDLPPIGKAMPSEAYVVPMPAGAKPRVPASFIVEMVASGLNGPRVIREAPNGDLFVAESKANTVRVLRMTPGSTKPSKNEIFATDLYQPYGIAFYPAASPQWVYVANSDGVVRFPYKNGDLKATGKPEKIVERIPWVHHYTRDIAFSPDGKRLLLSVGSGSNVALDMFPQPIEKGGLQAWTMSHPLGATWDTEDRRADVLSYDPDGKNEKILATGLRNCAGLTIQPETGRPWCVVNERDDLGDNQPFEYSTQVKDNGLHDWPWYYIDSNEDPRHKGERPDLKGKATNPHR